MTPLDKQLRRELAIDGKPYTLILDPSGLKLVEKGRRKGSELRWHDLVNGDAALAVALNASLAERPQHQARNEAGTAIRKHSIKPRRAQRRSRAD